MIISLVSILANESVVHSKKKKKTKKEKKKKKTKGIGGIKYIF